MQQFQVEDYESTLDKICRYYSGGSYQKFQEFKSVAFEGFVTLQNKYDPNRTTFTQFLNTTIRTEILIYLRREKLNARKKDAEGLKEIYPTVNTKTPESYTLFIDMVNSLSNDAQEIIRIIFESPEEIIGQSKNFTPKHYKGTLKQLLKTKKHWSMERIRLTFHEIKMALHEN